MNAKLVLVFIGNPENGQSVYLTKTVTTPVTLLSSDFKPNLILTEREFFAVFGQKADPNGHFTAAYIGS